MIIALIIAVTVCLLWLSGLTAFIIVRWHPNRIAIDVQAPVRPRDVLRQRIEQRLAERRTR